jgi:hypothetical protein
MNKIFLFAKENQKDPEIPGRKLFDSQKRKSHKGT